MSGIFRTFFITLDTIVYSILEVIFQLIIDLAHFQLFTSQTIDAFRNRIYLILGLVMFFKLIISFIQILIDPNKFDDKEQGLTGIIRRVIISMILIVIVPSIFELSRRLQDYIIPIIPKVILGVEADLTDENNPDNEDVTSSSGRIMAYYSFLPFFYYYDGCENGHLAGFGNNDQATIFSVPQAAAEVNLKDCPSTPDANGYTYRYQMFISTIVGAYLVYVLVTVALKIAIRAIKLSLCEIIAPIPIASYIDPKQSKESFDKWVQTSVKVYIDLFTRLVVVYFIIYIFQLLFNSDGGSKFQETIGQYGFIRGSLVILFIIVGLLQFAKEMPKFVSDMLGVKDGFSDIGDMFKGQGFRAIGQSIGGLAGAVANPFSSALSNYNYSKLKNERTATRLRRAVGGFFAGAGRSTSALIAGKGWKGSFTDARATTTANSRRRVANAVQRREARDEYERDMAAYNDAQQKLSDLYTKRESAVTSAQSAEQRAKTSWDEYIKARKRGDAVAANMHKNNYDNAKRNQALWEKNAADYGSEIGKLEKVSRPVRSAQYGLGRMSAALDNFTGTPRANSKTYHEAASWANSGKKIFNDAKAKVQEKPTLITKSLDLKDDNGNAFGNASFSDVFNAYKDMSEGRKITDARFSSMDRATLESVYGNALKDAAAEYVDGVFGGNISNNTMYQDIERWNYKKDNDIILDAADQSDLQAQLASKSIGNFFKSADEVGANYETKAVKYEKSERPPSDSN